MLRLEANKQGAGSYVEQIREAATASGTAERKRQHLQQRQKRASRTSDSLKCWRKLQEAAKLESIGD